VRSKNWLELNEQSQPTLGFSSQTRVPPNQRMKLSWRGGRLKGKGSILIAAAAPRSLCAIR